MKKNQRKNADFPYHVDNFLLKYMPARNLSLNTINSYGDTLLLFMEYIELKHSISRDNLCMTDITPELVDEFIQWLEQDRNCSQATCNNRLAAIKSFAKYVSKKDVKYVYTAQQIKALEAKETPSPVIKHLSKDQTKLLIETPNKNRRKGRRDLALLSLLYDSAARVQELCDLTVGSIRVDDAPDVTLTGKGNQTRTVPIMHGTATLLKSYLQENNLISPAKFENPLFSNARGEKLTRAGVTYIVKKYFITAKEKDPTMPDKISPHVLRHSRAMHMLQSGIHLVYIRDFLGHSFVQTTEVYAQADPETKRKNIEKAQLHIDTDLPDWRLNKKLMDFLEDFRKS